MKRIIDVSGELYSFCKNLVAEDEMARVIYFSTSLHEVKAEDCISREYLRKSMIEYGWSHPDSTVTEYVESLPGAYPKSDKPSGKWLTHKEYCDKNNLLPSSYGSYYWCSECDCGIDSKYFSRANYNYCPNCGAEMSKENKDDKENNVL